MKTKAFLIRSAALGALGITLGLAQTGSGSAGAGAGAGTGVSAGAGTSGIATGSTTSSSTNGGVNTAPVSPALPGSAPSSSSPLPGTAGSAVNASNPMSLPPGIIAAPAQPGISPISGLPDSQIPSTSAGTKPIGPNVSTSTTTSTSGSVPVLGAPVTTGSDLPSTTPAVPNGSIGPAGTVRVTTPPPAAPAEMPAGTAPNENSAWVAGHYTWEGGQWSWMNGSWQTPPQSGATWMPGRYDPQTHLWTEGHWDTGGSTTGSTRGEATPSRR